jgi:hypothetical protein
MLHKITNNIWHNTVGGWRHSLWNWNLALKLKLFTWLALENKINTWDNLQRKGWVGPNICHLCNREEESMQHIFINCAFTRLVWDNIFADLNLNTTWDGHSLADCYEIWSKNRPPLTKPPSYGLLVCVA